MNKIKNYKGFEIHLANNSHSALIHKGTELVKCIAGDILADGSNNRLEKAKKYIDSLNKFTPEQAAKMFGVSVERIKEQYLANAKGLEQMHTKAVNTGKKVNGYTANQLESMTTEYYQKAL